MSRSTLRSPNVRPTPSSATESAGTEAETEDTGSRYGVTQARPQPGRNAASHRVKHSDFQARLAAIRPRSPFTNPAESSVLCTFADSTASEIATASGTSSL